MGYVLKTGDPAPPFSLPDQDSRTVSLADYEGQYVVLYFYPKADTPGCTKEACEFRDRWDAFDGRDVAILGVSNDPVENLERFADKYDLPFPLLSDEDGSVATAYDSYGTVEIEGETYDIALRNTYLIDPDGRIESVYEDVSPEHHAEEILADI